VYFDAFFGDTMGSKVKGNERRRVAFFCCLPVSSYAVSTW
jgi:hypothetical protein